MVKRFGYANAGPFKVGYKKRVRFNLPTARSGEGNSRKKYGRRSRKTNSRGRYMGRKLIVIKT